jgi:dihydropteroate synthase
MIVMGILNVTPDSFADGGRHNDFEAAVHHGHEMLAEGVDIIDIGGESTKPGVERVSEEEELDRVIPVIKELANTGARISIDTMRASTARAAIKAGAQIINDVSGGLADPEMLPTAAQLGVPYIAMHWRGHSKDMNSRAVYGDVVKDVIAELQERVNAALDAGITKGNLILDPGIGFAKEAHHNWEIIDSIDQFVALGYPVLVGGSRKRFLGGDNPDEREAATIELTKRLSTSGIWGVRVHSVKAHKDVLSS